MKVKNTIWKLKEKFRNSKAGQRMAIMSALGTFIYVNSVCSVEAKTSFDSIKKSINNLSLAIMGVMSGVIVVVFAVCCQKEIITIMTGDEQEVAAAKKTIKKKIPYLIAGLMIGDLVVLVASYFVSGVTMPTAS